MNTIFPRAMFVIIMMAISSTAFAQTQSSPDEARKYLVRGMAAIESARSEDELADAAAEFLKATELAPNMAAAWYNLGSVQAKMGNLKDAIASYRRYLTLAPQANDAQRISDEILKLEYKLEKAERFKSRTGQWVDSEGNFYTLITEGNKLIIKGEVARSRANIDYNDYMIFNFGGLGGLGYEKISLHLDLRGNKLSGFWETPAGTVYRGDVCTLPAEKNEVAGQLDDAANRIALKLIRAKYKVVQVEPALFGSKYCQEVTITETRPVEMILMGPLPSGGVRYAGINDSGTFTVSKIEPGSAEEAAGIQKGDEIVAIDGTDLAQMKTAGERIMKIRGKPGTPVQITLKRNQTTIPFRRSDVTK